jgi:hypothetical protein
MGYYCSTQSNDRDDLLNFYMNMKATDNYFQPSGFNVSAVTSDNNTPLIMTGVGISPRGLTTHCTGEQISILHNIEDNGCKSKYQLLTIELKMHFKSGDLFQLVAAAQIVGIRRASQTEFEVNMLLCDMSQDSLRHIVRYADELSEIPTEKGKFN